MRTTLRTGLLALAIMALATAGCVLRVAEVIEVESEVGLEAAERVEAFIDASSARVEIGGGAATLMDAQFRFNSKRLEPEVDYRVSGDEGRLTVTQPSLFMVTIGPEAVNEWDIRFGDDVPLDLTVDLSSGDCDVDLSRMDVVTADFSASSGTMDVVADRKHDTLEELRASASSGGLRIELTGTFPVLDDVLLEVSSGDIEVDASGTWETDAKLVLEASSGQISVVVPDDVNVRVKADATSGSVTADGFVVDGDEYVLEVDDDAPTLTIEADVSSGNIRFQVE